MSQVHPSFSLVFCARIINNLKETSLPLELYFQIIHQNCYTFENGYLNDTKQQSVFMDIDI